MARFPSPDRVVTLVLTHACNLGCSYCYVGEKFRRRMALPLGKRGIDYGLTSMPKGSVLQLGYFGGEPLLEWDLLRELHAYARERAQKHSVRVFGSITTNATLLTPERMHWLRDHDCAVTVSIDGDQTGHDALRPLAGGGSSYAQVRAGLRHALAAVPMTQTISVVSPGNLAQLANGVRSLLAEGVRVLSLSMDYGAVWTEHDYDRLAEQMQEVAAIYCDAFRRGDDCYINPIDGKIIAHLKGGLAATDCCDAGGRELALSPEGWWYGCERLVGTDDAATRAAHGLGSTYTSEHGGPEVARQLDLARAQATEDPVCKVCAIKDRCAAHCTCSRIFSGGSAAEPGESQCRIEQIITPIADQVAETLLAERNPLFLRKRYQISEPASAGC